MASLVELQDALVNADRAGDSDAARKLADAIVGMRKVNDAKPVAVQAGGMIKDVGRQVGLTARYGIEGLGTLAQIGTEPLRVLTDAVTPNRAPSMGELVTGQRTPKSTPLSVQATKFADFLGLPSPQGANERVVGDATRLVAGAGGFAGAARGAASLLTGGARAAAQTMASNPMQQLVSGAGAGLSGGAVREAGGGEGAQFMAALAGGIATPLAANKMSQLAMTGARAVKNALTPAAVEMARADQQITLALQRSGIDWSQIPERIRQSMRAEVTQALNTGNPLNADAVRRLLVFRRANATPTVGQLTQDPGMITREKNLMKAGANSTNPSMQTLPALENQNVASFLRQLDDAGAAGAPSASGAGQRAIESLDSTVTRARANIDTLYRGARDTSGRSLPLEGGTFTTNANRLLDEANVGSFLPPDIAKKMNDIAGGRYPLTVDVAEQLKTSIGNLQRGSNDGNVRRALGLVRQALDDAPLQNDRIFNPSGVPAVPGSVPPSAMAAGEESISAFNAARTANREWMRRVEGNPALQAVVDGVEPDQFVQRYVIGKGASAADVAALRNELDPSAVSQMRSYLVRHLRNAATGGDDDIVKFGGKSYRNALRDLEDKLPAFFNAEEIQQLRDIGNAAKYMQAQPAGSAVNNSNSGALIIGRGLDMLEQAAQKLPVGRDAVTGVIQGMQQRQVMRPANALQLLAQQPQRRGNALMALPVVAAGQRPEDR